MACFAWHDTISHTHTAVSGYSYSEVDADAEGARQGCSDPSSLHAFKATVGMKCGGLDEDDNPQTLAECKAACCSDPACGIYQYTTVRQHAPSPPPCALARCTICTVSLRTHLCFSTVTGSIIVPAVCAEHPPMSFSFARLMMTPSANVSRGLKATDIAPHAPTGNFSVISKPPHCTAPHGTAPHRTHRRTDLLSLTLATVLRSLASYPQPTYSGPDAACAELAVY